MNGERYRYFIVEHETRGVLRDLEETPSGYVGRFSLEGARNDIENVEVFTSITNALAAIARLTPISKQRGCTVRCSQWEGDGFTDAWPIVGRPKVPSGTR